MDKWDLYMEIYQLLKQGFSKVAVAKKLNISRTTLYHYLQRSRYRKPKRIYSDNGKIYRSDPLQSEGGWNDYVKQTAV
ncbi:Helix-turn-helix domain of resolvase [Anoxybacillus thermarum]|uniref:Helix-turn-helix domain of resolvase n=1 Tax=Anoxybacillus thermarum TaxID=404937 RepID=A0A0D0QYY1_9BACL|nr:Helix-turn-helix domain of resolvase [Anoxybacillus thermarum]